MDTRDYGERSRAYKRMINGEFDLNSGERIPRWLCLGVSEQNNKKVLNGIGFLVSSAARSFNFGDWDIHSPNEKAIFSINQTSKYPG
ncbi:hypothetical protein [Draconibacterium sediminis]|uniref:Uncharacterized protein n=1 Tax=Draconibacterium sediminis TaxID=1544798 RepID=A0A0D8J7C4_9BACT|nr:hypothetical protein [Draconibacterium sediminis]KJF42777.1 hypothetical protein LH29_19855 [Draconibacterium sediminis]